MNCRIRLVMIFAATCVAVSTLAATQTPLRLPSETRVCGRVLSVTCARHNSDAVLLLEADDGRFLNVAVPSYMRDLIATVSEQHTRRAVCVTADTTLSMASTRVRLGNPAQLTIGGVLPVPGREDVASSCDPPVSMPQPLREERVMYTPDAMRAKISGSVLLHGIVEANGEVTGVRVIRPLFDSLDAAAARAFAQWRFAPAMRDGTPVPVAVTLESSFARGFTKK
jgi:TonB family protein